MLNKILWPLLLCCLYLPTSSASSVNRPPPLDKPTIIHTRMYVIDIDEINAAEQKITANIVFHVRWHDPRLAHTGPNTVTYPLSEIWHPNMQIVNQQRMWKTFPAVASVTPKGDVIYRQRVWGSFSQPLKLYKFPFDQQNFTIHLVAAGASSQTLKMVVDKTLPSGMAKQFSLPDWHIVKWSINSKVYEPFTGQGSVSGVTLTITAKRYVAFYLYKFVIPLIFIVLMSWLAFWIDIHDTASRITISVTAMLTSIAYRFIMSTTLPKVPYLTRLDLFILGSTLVIFISLIVIAILSHLQTSGKERYAKVINKIAIVLFPLIFIGTSIIPLVIY